MNMDLSIASSWFEATARNASSMQAAGLSSSNCIHAHTCSKPTTEKLLPRSWVSWRPDASGIIQLRNPFFFFFLMFSSFCVSWKTHTTFIFSFRTSFFLHLSFKPKPFIAVSGRSHWWLAPTLSQSALKRMRIPRNFCVSEKYLNTEPYQTEESHFSCKNQSFQPKDYLPRNLDVSKCRGYWRKYLLKRDSTTVSALLCSKINTYFYEPSASPARQSVFPETHLIWTRQKAQPVCCIWCIVANSADLSQKISVCFHRTTEHSIPQVRRDPQGSSSLTPGSSIRMNVGFPISVLSYSVIFSCKVPTQPLSVL